MIKSALETKLVKRLREKESGVYSPSANVIGNSNNIYSPGFTFAQKILGNRMPIGSSNGITKADNAGVSVRYKWENVQNINAD